MSRLQILLIFLISCGPSDNKAQSIANNRAEIIIKRIDTSAMSYSDKEDLKRYISSEVESAIHEYRNQ